MENQDPRPSPRPRRGIRAVQEWIEEAEAINRPWARNFLAVVLALALLVILLKQLGWLPGQ